MVGYRFRMDEQEWTARVYRFAIHGDLPTEAIEELHRAHLLQNQLTETYKRYEERVQEIWKQFPELQRIEERFAALDAELTELVEAAKQQRIQARSTKIDGTLRDQIKTKRAEIRELRAERRDAKTRTYLLAKPLLTDARNDRRAYTKSLYRVSVDGGLYWANFNEVTAHHETAIRQLSAARKAGKPADLRFRRWTGEGTLAVQLQRDAGRPQRTPALIASDRSPWRNVFSLSPAHDPAAWAEMTRGEQRRAARGIARFRIGSGDTAKMIEMPVIVHRPIPPEADIAMVRITRRRLAGRFKCFVSVVVRLPSIPQRTEGQVVTLHAGWRSLGDGNIRVAVAAGVKAPPAELRDVVRSHDDWHEIVVPSSWGNVAANGEKLQSQRDSNLDAVRAALLEWLADHPQDDENLAHVAKWRSPRRFVNLAMKWKDDPPEDSEEIMELLWAWKRQDRHLWEWQANERAQLVDHRTDTWRKVAAWLVQDAAVVVTDGWDMRALTTIPSVEDVDEYQARAARVNRAISAPGLLRERLSVTAVREGVRLIAPNSPISQTHYGCGGVFDPVERADQIMVHCPQCQQVVDQDYNALAHLRAASGPVAP